jgi:mediator of RNA polymerase II transcription subunit 14
LLPEKISDEEKQKTLNDLNRIVQCRLALSELPVQLKCFKIGRIKKYFVEDLTILLNVDVFFLRELKENGSVTFHVKNEFEIKLTLISDDFSLPWRVLKISFLVKDSQDPSNFFYYSLNIYAYAKLSNNQKTCVHFKDRQLVHNVQTNYVHDIVQMRLNENNRPLVDIYKSLHFFAHSLQLEILFDQVAD